MEARLNVALCGDIGDRLNSSCYGELGNIHSQDCTNIPHDILDMSLY